MAGACRRCQRRVAVLVLTAGVAAVGAGRPGPIAAAGIRDLTDGWLLGTGAVAALLGGAAGAGGPWLAAGQSSLYGMSELPLRALTGGFSLPGWPGRPALSAEWQLLGAGLYRDELRRLEVQFGRRPALGLDLRTFTQHTGGVDDVPAATSSRTTVAVICQAQWSPAADVVIGGRLWLAVGSAVSPAAAAEARRPFIRVQGRRGAAALAFAVDLKGDLTPAVGIEGMLGRGGAGCGLRLDLATATVGPVVCLRRGALLLRTSHLAHPMLGITHRVEVGWGAGGGAAW